MLVEIPECKRCCCCIPLRYGLIAWGYLKLALGSLALAGVCTALILLVSKNAEEEPQLIVITSILIVVFITDIVSNIIFVVGCHKKSVKLIKIFYYYSIFPFAVIVLIIVYVVVIDIIYLYKYFTIYFIYWLMDTSVLFIYIAIQVYVMLLVRSEIIKLKSGCQFRFVNNINEAECTLNMEEQTEIKLTE